MDDLTLRSLCRQLAAWAQSAIDDGGYPFRKAELFPSLSTPSGPLAPPLVFWINRDSFMAGGIVFFPDNDLDAQLAAGINTAQALGIDHFTTWDRSDITFWKITRGQATAAHTLPAQLPTKSSPTDYRNLLLQLLDTLKKFAVSGMIPSELLSPYYFANLFRTTLQATLPGLRDQHRRERAISPPTPAPDAAAETKATMSLLRLLALVSFDRLPASVQPEGLEQATRYALATLSTELHQALVSQNHELPLASAAAVRFHHLFRRLTQLHLTSDRLRTASAIELLLGSTFNSEGTPRPAVCQPGLLLVNPASTHAQDNPFYESAAQPQLAFFALIRALRTLPAASAQFTDPLHISPTTHPQVICGTLVNDRRPSARERTLLSTQLRVSWPGRRWALPPATPRWTWELLHLLGIAAPGAQIDLSTPGRWLASPFAPTLFEVLTKDFSVHQVRLDKPESLRFHLSKAADDFGNEILLNTPQGDRCLPSCRIRQAPGQVLALALGLPVYFFPMLAEGLLQPPTQELNSEQAAGARLFLRSSLGQLQTTILRKFGAPRTAERENPTSYSLLPTLEVLEALNWAFVSRPSPPQEEIDRELTRWLPLPPQHQWDTAPAQDAPMLRQKTARGPRPTPELEDLLIHTVFCDGIPLFPEHYLFDFLQPETTNFDLPAPLSLGETFFDRATLIGSPHMHLDVEGLATARALILCSHSDQLQVRLPVDQTLVRLILDRYQTDLRRLHGNLRQLAYQHLGSARQADNLTEQLWKRMRLPPFGLIQD